MPSQKEKKWFECRILRLSLARHPLNASFPARVSVFPIGVARQDDDVSVRGSRLATQDSRSRRRKQRRQPATWLARGCGGHETHIN